MSSNTVLEFASIPRNLDSWNIGMRRVNKIMEQEREAGFHARSTGIYSDTIDIFVFKGGELIRVYEVTNYAMKGYIQLDRGERYKNNLLQYPVEKVFVCSSDQNLIPLGGRDFFKQHGIEVRVMGYQD